MVASLVSRVKSGHLTRVSAARSARPARPENFLALKPPKCVTSFKNSSHRLSVECLDRHAVRLSTQSTLFYYGKVKTPPKRRTRKWTFSSATAALCSHGQIACNGPTQTLTVYGKWSKVSAGTDDEHALFVDACWRVPVQLL